jgi:hypothetical protein
MSETPSWLCPCCLTKNSPGSETCVQCAAPPTVETAAPSRKRGPGTAWWTGMAVVLVLLALAGVLVFAVGMPALLWVAAGQHLRTDRESAQPPLEASA